MGTKNYSNLPTDIEMHVGMGQLGAILFKPKSCQQFKFSIFFDEIRIKEVV